MGNDFAALLFVLPGCGFRPQVDAGRNAVNAHLRRQLLCQRPRQPGQAGFGGVVQQVPVHRQLGMDIDDIDDAAVTATQFCRCRLGQEQRRFQVGADQVAPLLLVQLVQRRREKTGCVVHHGIKMAELLYGFFDHARQRCQFDQVGLHDTGRIGPFFVQFRTQRQRVIQRSATVDRHIRTRRMQTPHDGRTDAFRPACHQYCFALHPIPH